MAKGGKPGPRTGDTGATPTEGEYGKHNGWFPKIEALQACGRTSTWLTEARAWLPEGTCATGEDRRAYVHLPTLIRALVDKVRRESEGGDDMADAERREAIARADKRQAEAERVQSENEQRRNLLLPRDLVHQFHTRVSESLRKLGERFARKTTIGGSEAQRQLNGVLEGYARELENLIESKK